MVRPATAFPRRIGVHRPERHTPSAGHMAAGHEFPHARRLQTDPAARAVHVVRLQGRQGRVHD